MDKYLGEKIDNRYEVLEIIGVGGMAVVYKARCHKLNRLVALKILKDDYAQDADFKRRFHAEAQAVAMLSHPNIVAVYDVARSGSVEYIVMELIDGITLKQYMQKKGNLSWRESLHFSTQIAKALSHAHNRGIIHRDIKPHNIMILRDGSVKVADFGIARFASKQNTLTQEALGSVHYISPEQARGSHIDARSDIYSVGVVMYEMLTSRLPYEGDSPVSVAIQHINSIPLTPREVNPNIPEALETITMKAMSASLSKRYASAEALLHDLEEFRKNPSISFDYDITELMARDEEDEPTRNFKNTSSPSGGAAESDGKVRTRSESADDEVYKARQRNRAITMITGLACVLIFISGMTYMVVTFLSGLGNSANSNSDDTTVVPNLFGQNYYEVIAENDMYKDINIVMNEEGEYHDFVPEGCIIKQDPEWKKTVKKGTTVTVTLSRGQRTFKMPNLTGMEYRAAQNMLVRKEYNLKYGASEYEISETVVKDHVIRTDPAVNEDVHEGQEITLVISLGPEIKMVKMPNLVGMMQEQAEAQLEELDLNGVVTYVDSAKPEGEVVWQSEEVDKEIETKTEIQYQVSRPLTSPSPSPEVESPSPSPSPSPEVETPTPSPDVTTPTPSPDVTTPTPTPSPTPTDTVVTVPVTIALPSTPGMTSVSVKKNGIICVMDEFNNSLGSVTFDITGSPNDSLDIYFGDDIQFTRLLGQP